MLEMGISPLTKGLGRPFEYTGHLGMVMNAIPSDVQHFSHPITGYWVGTLFHSINASGRDKIPPVTINIYLGAVVNNQFSGTRIFHASRDPTSHTITGYLSEIQDHESGITKATFKLHHPGSQLVRICAGEYSHQREIIKGYWKDTISEYDDETSDNIDDEVSYSGAFFLTRSPPHAFRFLDLLYQPIEQEEKSPNLARRRWAFALQAVIFRVLERRSPWEFIRARIAERNTWIELYTKWSFYKLSTEEIEWLARLIVKIHPINRHIYDTTAIYLHERKQYSIS